MSGDLHSATAAELKDQLISAVEASLQCFSSFPVLRQEIASLGQQGKIHLLAIGKSAVSMAIIAMEELSARELSCDGYLLTKYGYAQSAISGLITLEAGHPLPDANSLKHSTTILTWLEQLPSQDTLMVLLSGGGSALFEVPEAGYTLEGIIELNRELLRSGLSIATMNEQRCKFSKVKGGKALKHVACHRICVFALSDVAGNDPQVIASGPFTPASEADTRVSYRIIGDNLSFRKLIATKLLLPAVVIDEYLCSSASEVSAYLEESLHSALQPGIYLRGGEAPVIATGSGSGGRCTHLALDFAIRIAGKPGISLLCYASDGCDNIEGIAGAFVDGHSFSRMQKQGINPREYLKNTDSLPALRSINAIIPGTSLRINVNDIYMMCLGNL